MAERKQQAGKIDSLLDADRHPLDVIFSMTLQLVTADKQLARPTSRPEDRDYAATQLDSVLEAIGQAATILRSQLRNGTYVAFQDPDILFSKKAEPIRLPSSK